jgi:hypothetical protein
MEASLVRGRIEALGVELGVDRVGSDLARVQIAPQSDQPVVVLAPALRTGTVAGRERGHLVEEEELRVPARLLQRASSPAAELEPASDPALHRETTANAALGVVEATAVAVDEAAGRVRDEIAERRDPVLERAQT